MVFIKTKQIEYEEQYKSSSIIINFIMLREQTNWASIA